MRIAINTRLLLPGRLDGIGWFTAETVKRVVTAHPEHEFYFLFDRKPDSSYLFASNVHPVVLCPQARHPILWYMFFEWSVTHALKKYHIDLFVSPDGWMSLRSMVPSLIVIHDLNFEHSPNYLRRSHQRYMTRFFPQFAKKATRIATVSEFSRQDIVTTYGIDKGKIDVVYDGAHANYQPNNEQEKQATRNQYTQGCPYFIFIGTISKRKNLTNQLLAFDEFKRQDTKGTKLVVVGARVWWQDDLKTAYENMQYANDVIFIGRAEADELARLLSAATALLYASLFEGFGIPILESYYAETPVITSNCTSMPEVAGDAALLVDPYNVQEITQAMVQLADSEQLRQQLVERGRVQRTKFSWDITAERMWASICATMGPQGR